MSAADLALEAQAAIRDHDAKHARECIARLRLLEHGDDVRVMVGVLEFSLGDVRGAFETLRRIEKKTADVWRIVHTLALQLNEAEAAHEAADAVQNIPMHRTIEDCIAELDDLEGKELPVIVPQISGRPIPARSFDGFLEAEARWRRWVVARAPSYFPTPGAAAIKTATKMLPLWAGEAVDRLCVLFIAGRGDTFMMGRYLQALRTKAARITAIVSPDTAPLVSRCAPGIEVIPWRECREPIRAADAYCYWAMLPGMAGGYGNAEWLAPDPALCEQWRPRGPGRHIGIVWGGSAGSEFNESRSVPIAMLRALFELPGITWHSLQVGPKARECPEGVIDYSGRIRNFHDTAALIAGLDVVVSVDTGVANLAGAMGKRLWLLAESVCDFRWSGDGDRTPWFPSARVFRQETPGEWGSAIERIRRELQRAARALCATSAPCKAGRREDA